jgi:hypothetical protein
VLGVQDIPGLPPDSFKALAVGQQAVAKGRQGSSALNKVQVRVGGKTATMQPTGTAAATALCQMWPAALVGLLRVAKCRPLVPADPLSCPCDALHTQVILCVVRLPQHGSDVLLTLNSPIFISEHSAAAEHAGELELRFRTRL